MNVEIKNAEILLSSDSKTLDTRKGLNRALKVTFPESFIQNLKSEGLSIEELDKVETPIFKYRGQITIHGIFDAETTIRVGNYANVIINGNKSIGIKYNAIDYAKKKSIAKALSLLGSKITYYRNSNTEYFSLTHESVEPIKELYNKVDTNLFIGTKEVVRYSVWGKTFYACVIHLNAIYDVNIWKLITNLTDKNESDYNIAKEVYRTEQIKNDIEYKKESDLRKIKESQQLEINKCLLKELNLPLWNNQFKEKIQLIKVKNSSYEPFEFIQMTKKGMWYTIRCVNSNKIEIPNFDTYNINKKSFKSIAELLKSIKGEYYITLN